MFNEFGKVREPKKYKRLLRTILCETKTVNFIEGIIAMGVPQVMKVESLSVMLCDKSTVLSEATLSLRLMAKDRRDGQEL